MSSFSGKQSGGKLDGLSGVKALSVLFSFIMPEAKAKKTAAALLERFGSFSATIEAPEAELLRVDEVDETTASFIRTSFESYAYYMEDKNLALKRVYDSKSAYEVLLPKFVGAKKELVGLLLLDGRGRIIFNDIVNEGAVSEVPIYIRRIVELCLMYDAYTAIIAHNHPSGSAVPSRNDINSTRDIEFAFNAIDVELFDHIIIAEEDYLSLKSSEWLDVVKQEVADYKKAMKQDSEEQERALFAD